MVLSIYGRIPTISFFVLLFVIQTKGSWISVPRGHFPALVSIKGRGREHICTGMLVNRRHILTAASCIKETGPNPILEIGVNGANEDRWMFGVQEYRAELVHIHPKWTGDIDGGYDAALLQLPWEVDGVLTPKIADNHVQVYANMKVHVLQIGSTLEIAQFDVVDNTACPMMKELGANTFCIYSAGSHAAPGLSGSPVLMIDGQFKGDVSEDILQGKPNSDIIVGIVSAGNYSSLQESGIACTLINSSEKWVKGIVSHKENAAEAFHTTAMVVIVTSILLVVFFIPAPFSHQVLVAVLLCLILLMIFAWWSPSIQVPFAT